MIPQWLLPPEPKLTGTVRDVYHGDEPEFWAELDRQLSPEELPYLLALDTEQ